MYIVVTGPPASGKSTTSVALGGAFDLPVLAKDTIKTALVDVLGADNVEESRRLGQASVAALLAVAFTARRGVIDSVWVDRAAAIASLSRLPGPVIEVFCRCDVDVLRARYAHRASGRGPGHFDLQRESAELWNDDSLRPLDGGWPVIELHTSHQLDIDALATAVRNAKA